MTTEVRRKHARRGTRKAEFDAILVDMVKALETHLGKRFGGKRPALDGLPGDPTRYTDASEFAAVMALLRPFARKIGNTMLELVVESYGADVLRKLAANAELEPETFIRQARQLALERGLPPELEGIWDLQAELEEPPPLALPPGE